jgi:DNA-binding transcriptional LysR family regulator
VRPRTSIVFRSDDNSTVQALVAAGVGAAVMPRLTADLDHHRTTLVDVPNLFPPLLLGMVWLGAFAVHPSAPEGSSAWMWTGAHANKETTVLRRL